MPFITVVMPVRNEGRSIGSTLAQLLAQDYDPGRFEVLVVDGESTDATRAIVLEVQARDPRVRLLPNPGRLSSSARNVGVRHARGEFIVIIDGHCDLRSRNYLADLADAFDRSGADCLGRPQPLDVAGASAVQRAIAAARSSRLGHHPASFIYSEAERFVPPQSVAVAYRRSVFDAVGPFDEAFDACEDVEFNHRVDRAGLRCFFSPRIRAYYHPRSGLRGLFRQMVRYARGRVRLLRKHPETLSVPSLLPAAFVLGLLVGPVLGGLSGHLMAAYVAALALYGLAVAAAALAIALRPGRLALLPWLPLAFLTIHIGTGVGALLEALAPPTPAGPMPTALPPDPGPRGAES